MQRLTTQVKHSQQHTKYVPGPSAQPAVDRDDLDLSDRYLKAKLAGRSPRRRPAVYVARGVPRGRATTHPDCSAGGVNTTRLHPDYDPLLASQKRVKAIKELCTTPRYYKTR